MSLKKSFIKGGMVLGLSQLAGQACSLGRNVIIARLVSPADFGIAAIFVMVMAFLDMISNLSLDRLLVQAEDGDEALLQNTAHYLHFLRGVASCTIILIFAGPLATLFSVPQAKYSFYALAFIPLINGFIHLDSKRMEREMQFWPGASVELASQIISLLLAWPLGGIFGDYRAMLALLFIKTIITVAGTHLVSSRTYTWSRNREYIRRFFIFGWPLLISGILLFSILQGDRFIIGAAKKLFGSSYDMTDVGLYSAAFTLSMIPAMMCTKISDSLLLPILSRIKNAESDFIEKSQSFGNCLAVIAALFAACMVLFGKMAITLVYGNNYEAAATLVGWLSISWAIRIMRIIPSSMAMAKGNTIIFMHTNFVRILALIFVLLIVAWDLPILWIARIAAGGEAIAYLWSLYLIQRRLHISFSVHSRQLLIFLLLLLPICCYQLYY